MMNRFIIEDARQLGFKLTLTEYGTIKRDFQLLGYNFIKGIYKERNKNNE